MSFAGNAVKVTLSRERVVGFGMWRFHRILVDDGEENDLQKANKLSRPSHYTGADQPVVAACFNTEPVQQSHNSLFNSVPHLTLYTLLYRPVLIYMNRLANSKFIIRISRHVQEFSTYKCRPIYDADITLCVKSKASTFSRYTWQPPWPKAETEGESKCLIPARDLLRQLRFNTTM